MQAMRPAQKMPAGRRATLLAKLNGKVGETEEAFLGCDPSNDA